MIQLGIYRHYKGPLYQVLGIAHDANADTLFDSDDAGVGTVGNHDVHYRRTRGRAMGERTVVVYIPLQLDGAHLGPRMAVRTLEDFEGDAEVDETEAYAWLKRGGMYARRIDDGDMFAVRRFTYLGPELTVEMLPDPVPA
jgi:hypothetical protein